MDERKQLFLSLLRAAGKNRWLAFNEDETAIVAESESIEEAIQRAHDAGVKDPILMWSPEEWALLVA
jgi:hypothetical protein